MKTLSRRFHMMLAAAVLGGATVVQAATPGNTLVMLDHEAGMQMADQLLEISEPIIRRLGIHWDQQ